MVLSTVREVNHKEEEEEEEETMTQKTPLCPTKSCYLIVLGVYLSCGKNTSLDCKDRKQLKGLHHEFGLQGRKAAKRFTSRERGRVKYKYHRRKVVWDTILRLLGRGHSIHTAVGQIERVYGEGKTVSTYINLLQHDRRVGHHRDLR